MFTVRGVGGSCASQTAAADRHKMRTSNTKDKCTDRKQSHRSKSCIATSKYSSTAGAMHGNGGNGGLAVLIAWEWQLGKKVQRTRAAQPTSAKEGKRLAGKQGVQLASTSRTQVSARTEQAGSRECVRSPAGRLTNLQSSTGTC